MCDKLTNPFGENMVGKHLQSQIPPAPASIQELSFVGDQGANMPGSAVVVVSYVIAYGQCVTAVVRFKNRPTSPTSLPMM